MQTLTALLLLASGVLASMAHAAEIYSTTEDYVWQERFAARLELARAGNAEAQFNIGEMYEKGSGVHPDLKSAFTWFELAAEQGHQKAEYKIAYMYYRGEGVAANPVKAFYLMDRLAKNGYARAQYYLAFMHETGDVTQRDLNQAYLWYSRAAAGGYTLAKDALADKKRFPAPPARIETAAKLPAVAAAKAPPNNLPHAATIPAPPIPKAGAKNPHPSPATNNSVTAGLRSEVTRGTQIALGTGRSAARQDVLTSPLASIAGLQPPTRKQQTPYAALANGNWVSQGNLPVEFLPSQLTSCELSNERAIECVSRNLVKTIGAAEVGYQTLATVYALQPTGEFKITYRNNIVKINRRDDSKPATKAGGVNKDIKLGMQEAEHHLECKFENDRTIQCVKNQTQKIILTNQAALLNPN